MQSSNSVNGKCSALVYCFSSQSDLKTLWQCVAFTHSHSQALTRSHSRTWASLSCPRTPQHKSMAPTITLLYACQTCRRLPKPWLHTPDTKTTNVLLCYLPASSNRLTCCRDGHQSILKALSEKCHQPRLKPSHISAGWCFHPSHGNVLKP